MNTKTIHTMNDNKIKLALQWFKDNDVSAYVEDGSIYVVAGIDADVQITSSEINYRAELQTNQD